MHDFFGREVKVGDSVLYGSARWGKGVLTKGKVTWIKVKKHPYLPERMEEHAGIKLDEGTNATIGPSCDVFLLDEKLSKERKVYRDGTRT